ncbi:diaminopimelate epimerase [Propionibacterium cyclohexanicum]|nr:diaminopimelate epimerase [Propionibacterium cyclohexanicum]
MRSWGFSKGHGTSNDFVLLKDRTNSTPLCAEDVRFLCDRHRGIGADGVIRAVKAEFLPEWHGDPSLWFMDYRNADGSIAQMCGNGLRVFARYLLDEDYVNEKDIQVATRAGTKSVRELNDGRFRADLGPLEVSEPRTAVRLAAAHYEAVHVDVGNPHAVVFLDSAAELDALDLTGLPQFDSDAYPEGANLEFVWAQEPRALRMRVHERGSGETLSCGTGVVASAAAQLGRLGESGRVDVTVPGGELSVDIDGSHAFLTGPAVIVATGTVYLPDLPRP